MIENSKSTNRAPIKKIDISKEPQKYNSLVDEYHRNKVLKKTKIFNIKEEDDVWHFFIIAFKKTFKIRKELKEGIKFVLKINSEQIHYEIEKFDTSQHYLLIKWKNHNDQYWLEYYVKNHFIFKNKTKIRIRQILYRDKTFFGLSDQVGVYLYKNRFNKNIKSFIKSMKYVQNNLQEMSEEYPLTNDEKNINNK